MNGPQHPRIYDGIHWRIDDTRKDYTESLDIMRALVAAQPAPENWDQAAKNAAGLGIVILRQGDHPASCAPIAEAEKYAREALVQRVTPDQLQLLDAILQFSAEAGCTN